MKSTHVFAALLMTVSLLSRVDAAVTSYTDRVAWEAAILAVDPLAVLRLEDFNDDTVTPGTPGVVGFGLDAGPHAYGQVAGEVSMTLNGIGNGGSQTGIVNPGALDGSNALEIRVNLDSLIDVVIIPGVLELLGEGVQSAGFSFASPVVGFGGDYQTVLSHDGVQISVNGELVSISGDGISGDGFFGIVDDAMPIAAFSFLPDDQHPDPQVVFEEFELDDFEYASRSNVVPEPSSIFVWCGIAWVATGIWSRRRRDVCNLK